MHIDNLSETDRRILRQVQKDWSRTRQQLAEAVNLSGTTLWRRLSELTDAGTIQKRVALLDPEAVGLPICVFISVNMVNHEAGTRQAFEVFVQDTPQIMECFSITGAFDYMLIVRAETVVSFETFLMDRILGHPSVGSATSQISLRQQKYTTALPL